MTGSAKKDTGILIYKTDNYLSQREQSTTEGVRIKLQRTKVPQQTSNIETYSADNLTLKVFLSKNRRFCRLKL